MAIYDRLFSLASGLHVVGILLILHEKYDWLAWGRVRGILHCNRNADLNVKERLRPLGIYCIDGTLWLASRRVSYAFISISFRP